MKEHHFNRLLLVIVVCALAFIAYGIWACIELAVWWE
jgi:hypothetical protein